MVFVENTSFAAESDSSGRYSIFKIQFNHSIGKIRQAPRMRFSHFCNTQKIAASRIALDFNFATGRLLATGKTAVLGY